MEFVAFVGSDKENWGQITALINRIDADKIIIIKSKEAGEFPLTERCDEINIDSTKPLMEMKEELLEQLKKILAGDFEVSLSLASGNGKEHMAVVSALLSVPVGIRLVVFTKEGIRFLT